MKIKYLSKDAIEEEISNIIINEIKSNPKCVLGLATGSSPLGIYNRLIKAYKQNEISFKKVTSFNLDEYLGIEETHEKSYRYFMNENLFNKIDIDKSNTFVPNGFIKSDKEASQYDYLIESKGGIDIQLLGLGSDGHIAFNEPGTSFDSLTHIAKLTDQTIKDNARFFNNVNEVPTKAITMGLKSIMNAKKILLIATGISKAKAIKSLISDDVNINLPVSILKEHKNAIIYVDSSILN